MNHPDVDVVAAFDTDIPAAAGPAGTFGDRLRQYLPAAVTFVLVIVGWEVLTRALSIESFILPKPSEIIEVFIAKAGVIWSVTLNTFYEAIVGFTVGTILAVLAALATARWKFVREGALPMAIAANSVPIIALAPIANVWFTITSPVSKMAVVAVIVFFPVMINTSRGLLDVDASEQELLRSYAAKPRETMRMIRVPSALPYFFSALKVASALSLIGAIVAEYFGGPQDVLGQYIINRANLFQFPDAWAAILAASLIGIAFYVVIVLVERAVMPWHVSVRGD